MPAVRVGDGKVLSSLDVSGAEPVLSDAAFAQRQTQLRAALATLGAEPLALPAA